MIDTEIPLSHLGDPSHPSKCHKYNKYDNIWRCLIIVGFLILVSFHIIQFYMASQIVNSDIWNEIQKLNIRFYRIQIELLMTKANQTIYQIDRLNISSYEAQIQTLLTNANQTLAQLNNVIVQISHFLPPKYT